ncbi:hypothetical protein SAMN04487949_1359 [Halogranum gelatinilyticum]|uniref:Uncharacterized protein n=1 Tax=Halogranum gelatinilyticum TaxID=660521 RepID=A0A1G9SH47_9EURY|nr:hypothetical protein [Halogranum gelatinilyticum]SDM34793.1 hypothetical protein SAMN04487949_1359 [Halogranum gelatinilyticum]
MDAGDDSLSQDLSAGTAASPIRAIQDAALERALLSPTGNSDYVAFVGALERTHRRGDRELSLSGAAMLSCLLSLHLDGDGSNGRDRLATADPTDRNEPLVAGALVAFDRFDISLSTAASLANRSVDDFETELERRRDR